MRLAISAVLSAIISTVCLGADAADPASAAPDSEAAARASEALMKNEVEDLGFETLEASAEEKKALAKAKGNLPGKIVWQSLRDNNWNIYSMNTDGTELQRLTDDPLEDENPSWAPDGSFIAFDSRRGGHRGVYTMKPDGSEQKLLIDNARAPFCSADGRTIVFQRGWKLFSYNLANETERELVPGNIEKVTTSPREDGGEAETFEHTTALETVKSFNPTLSTNGKTLAFATDVRFPWEVAVMPMDGSTVTIVGWGVEPVWLPGKSEIVFTREAARSGSDLLMRSATGGRLSLVSELNMPWGYEYSPAISPDGRWLVWSASRRHDPDAANYEIFVRRFENTDAKPLRLTFHTAPDREPCIYTRTEAEN